MNQQLLEFFTTLDRSFFIDSPYKEFSYLDAPLPIGYGQTISQQSLVLSMTDRLKLDKDCSVLEIGTGSGFQTVLLAEFSNKVFTIELIEELSISAKKRLDHLGYANIHYRIGDGSEGWPEMAPFDRIILTAAPTRMPNDIIDQLNFGGIMILPVGPHGNQQLKLISKDMQGSISEKFLTYVAFVDMIGKYCEKDSFV